MSNKNRIDKLDQELRNVQPTPEAVRWSLEEFEKTGQLPGDHVLGRWVVQQVLARPHADLRRMLFHVFLPELIALRKAERTGETSRSSDAWAKPRKEATDDGRTRRRTGTPAAASCC